MKQSKKEPIGSSSLLYQHFSNLFLTTKHKIIKIRKLKSDLCAK